MSIIFLLLFHLPAVTLEAISSTTSLLLLLFNLILGKRLMKEKGERERERERGERERERQRERERERESIKI